jgi:hypothetical protein
MLHAISARASLAYTANTSVFLKYYRKVCIVCSVCCLLQGSLSPHSQESQTGLVWRGGCCQAL